MYELKNVEPTPEQKKTFGTWGEAPPGWEEITEQEFARMTPFHYTPTHIEYRQFYIGKELFDPHLMIQQNGTGWAIITRQSTGTVRYFRFGCRHDYVEINRPAGHRSGLHTDKCSRCGFEYTYDTSD